MTDAAQRYRSILQQHLPMLPKYESNWVCRRLHFEVGSRTTPIVNSRAAALACIIIEHADPGRMVWP